MSALAIDQEAYRELIARKLPHVIHTEEENEQYIAELEALYSQEEMTPAERQLAELLALLIEKFEERYQIEPAATPIDVLHLLMEAHNLKQSDVLDIFGTKSTASEVLSGKRDLSKAHIQRLASRFHVSPEVFFAPEMMQTDNK
jgi:HTH-type transcriptional regulator/antitoxin HigA